MVVVGEDYDIVKENMNFFFTQKRKRKRIKSKKRMRKEKHDIGGS
jgi:hypothetical protein